MKYNDLNIYYHIKMIYLTFVICIRPNIKSQPCVGTAKIRLHQTTISLIIVVFIRFLKVQLDHFNSTINICKREHYLSNLFW